MLDLEGAVAGIGGSAKILLGLLVIAGGMGTAYARFLTSEGARALPRARIA